MPRSSVHPFVDHLRRMPAKHGGSLSEYVAAGVEALSYEELVAVVEVMANRLMEVKIIEDNLRAMEAAGFEVVVRKRRVVEEEQESATAVPEAGQPSLAFGEGQGSEGSGDTTAP